MLVKIQRQITADEAYQPRVHKLLLQLREGIQVEHIAEGTLVICKFYKCQFCTLAAEDVRIACDQRNLVIHGRACCTARLLPFQ